MFQHSGHVTSSEDEWMRLGLQGIIDDEKAFAVCLQTRLNDPRRRGSGCDPKRDVEGDGGTRLTQQKTWFDFGHSMAEVHMNAAFTEDARKLCLHATIVAGENGFGVGHEVKLNASSVGDSLKICLEPKLSAKGQFDAPCPTP